MSRGYGWIVDVDHLAESSGDSRVGTFGPWGIPYVYRQHLETAARPFAPLYWRCKDDDGELTHEGRYLGPRDERQFGPLFDLAMPDAGACHIEYLSADTGQWEEL